MRVSCVINCIVTLITSLLSGLILFYITEIITVIALPVDKYFMNIYRVSPEYILMRLSLH